MLVNQANITEKKYRKLSLCIAPGGFSFCITDTLNDQVLSVACVDFSAYPKNAAVSEYYKQAFAENAVLTESYDSVLALQENQYNTFVPQALFDENFPGSYLQYTAAVFPSDTFAFEPLANYEMNNVYVPFSDINQLLQNQHRNFEYRHANTVLVSQLLQRSRNVDEKQVFAHFSHGFFELVIVQNQKLLLFNSFEFRTKEDFLYYLLFTAEQLSLNPESFKLQLLGDVDQQSEWFEIAFKYVRNTSLLDVSEMQQRNGLSEHENRRHFVLLNS